MNCTLQNCTLHLVSGCDFVLHRNWNCGPKHSKQKHHCTRFYRANDESWRDIHKAWASNRFWMLCLFIANNNDRLVTEYAHAHSFSSLYMYVLYISTYSIEISSLSKLICIHSCLLCNFHGCVFVLSVVSVQCVVVSTEVANNSMDDDFDLLCWARKLFSFCCCCMTFLITLQLFGFWSNACSFS